MTTVAPLALDAPREEVLERALHLISDAWRSFDHYRSEEPPLDERVRALLDARLPEEPTAAFEALDDVARILDESIAQPRPRYFAFIGSSGLPIGVVGDALASCYDVNLARYAAAATEVERQAVRWVAEFVGFPSDAGSVTSGGTVSNLTALAAARERALPGCRLEGPAGRRAAIYASDEVHYSVRRAVEILGIGAKSLRIVPMDADHRLRPEALAEALDRDLAAGATPVAVVASAGTTLTGAVDPTRRDRRRLRRAGRLAARRRRVRAAGSGTPATRALFQASSGRTRHPRRAQVAVSPKACSVVLARDERRSPRRSRTSGATCPVGRAVEPRRHHAGVLAPLPRRSSSGWPFAFTAPALRAAIERNIAQARLLADEVRRHPTTSSSLLEPQLTIVPFRHVPGGVADLDAHNLRLAEAIQADDDIYLARPSSTGALGSSLHRQLPDDRRGRPRPRRDRARGRSAARRLAQARPPVERRLPTPQAPGRSPRPRS